MAHPSDRCQVCGSTTDCRSDGCSGRSLTPKEKIEIIRQYYLRTLVEDPMDGTDFDCLILDTLADLDHRDGNHLSDLLDRYVDAIEVRVRAQVRAEQLQSCSTVKPERRLEREARNAITARPQ
jgi:hypothetical protein